MEIECNKENIMPRKVRKLSKKDQLAQARLRRHQSVNDARYKKCIKEYTNTSGRTRPEGEKKLIIQALCYQHLQGNNDTDSVEVYKEYVWW